MCFYHFIYVYLLIDMYRTYFSSLLWKETTLLLTNPSSGEDGEVSLFYFVHAWHSLQ